jgi:hypothetical protein
MRNDQYVGLEFDWLAADSCGRLAVFSTAGFGPISCVALATAGRQESAISVLLPKSHKATHSDYLSSDEGLPFYIYDWKPHGGPYLLKKSPADTNTATLDSLPMSIHDLVTRMQIDFTTCNSISEIPKGA